MSSSSELPPWASLMQRALRQSIGLPSGTSSARAITGPDILEHSHNQESVGHLHGSTVNSRVSHGHKIGGGLRTVVVHFKLPVSEDAEHECHISDNKVSWNRHFYDDKLHEEPPNADLASFSSKYQLMHIGNSTLELAGHPGADHGDSSFKVSTDDHSSHTHHHMGAVDHVATSGDVEVSVEDKSIEANRLREADFKSIHETSNQKSGRTVLLSTVFQTLHSHIKKTQESNPTAATFRVNYFQDDADHMADSDYDPVSVRTDATVRFTNPSELAVLAQGYIELCGEDKVAVSSRAGAREDAPEDSEVVWLKVDFYDTVALLVFTDKEAIKKVNDCVDRFFSTSPKVVESDLEVGDPKVAHWFSTSENRGAGNMIVVDANFPSVDPIKLLSDPRSREHRGHDPLTFDLLQDSGHHALAGAWHSMANMRDSIPLDLEVTFKHGKPAGALTAYGTIALHIFEATMESPPKEDDE